MLDLEAVNKGNRYVYCKHKIHLYSKQKSIRFDI